MGCELKRVNKDIGLEQEKAYQLAIVTTIIYFIESLLHIVWDSLTAGMIMLKLPETYAEIGLALDANKDGGRILYDKDGNELKKTFSDDDVLEACYVYGQGFKAGMEKIR